MVQGIPETRNAWHAGDGESGNGNRCGIGVEICYSESGGKKFIAAEKLAAKFIAEKLDEKIATKVRAYGKDHVLFTRDTHFENYLDTREGKLLPVIHCIKGTPGWELDDAIAKALEGKAYTPVEKLTFGSVALPRLILQAAGSGDFDITILGLCTDICVVSNALILKANFPEKEIIVDSACCAGVTPQSHEAALATMAMCQITVK